MRRIYFRIATMFCILFITGCTHSRNTQIMKRDAVFQSDNGNDIIGIASMSGLDRPLQQMTEKVLVEHGIRCAIEGSVVYGIWVYRKDADTAVAVLKNDVRLTGQKIRFLEKPYRTNPTPGATL